MSFLNTLLSQVMPAGEQRRTADGFAVWIHWAGELDPTVPRTMQEYGGMPVAQEEEQSLWFFFTPDVLQAAARLQSWVKLRTARLTFVLMPARLGLTDARVKSVEIAADLSSAGLEAPKDFCIWVHPRVREAGAGIPGLTYKKSPSTPVLLGSDWMLLEADSRLPFQTSFGWYCVLKPLGNPLEKGFQSGWRIFFSEIEDIIRKHKFRYILNDNFLCFSLETIKQMHGWCHDFLHLIAQQKTHTSERYWPCVMAIVDKRGLNFNNELPKKLGLDWDQLISDFPHMSYRSAMMLGDGEFTIHEARFDVAKRSMDDWCTVSLRGSGAADLGAIPVRVAHSLTLGKQPPCFYCGMRNHTLSECPTRQFEDWSPESWRVVGTMDFETINKNMDLIDARGIEEGVAGFQEILAQKDGASSLLRAVFDINHVCQIPMLHRVWLARGKECPKGFFDLGAKDDSKAWKALEMFSETEAIPMEKELASLALKYPRDNRIRALQGFSALERGDINRAVAMWKEAQSLSVTPPQHAYHLFLQARALEIQGRYEHAKEMYELALQYGVSWIEPRYRQLVCLVKMGFAEKVVPLLVQLSEDAPDVFNRALLDPEMERGRIYLLTAMYEPWAAAKIRAQEEGEGLKRIRSDLGVWFPENHSFAVYARGRIESVLAMGEYKNYSAFMLITQNRASLSREMQKQINNEARELHNKFIAYRERLQDVQEEATWFPFPKLLVEFNKNFNICAQSLNSTLKATFHLSDTFKKAQQIAESLDKRLAKLESQMRFLKVVRDITLFVLIMGKTFFWIELVFMLLLLIGVPLVIYYGDRMGLDVISTMLFKQKWQIQKGLAIVLSIIALIIASFRTVIVFDGKKEKLLMKNQDKADNKKPSQEAAGQKGK